MLHIDQVCDRPGLLALEDALALALGTVSPVTEHKTLALHASLDRVTTAGVDTALPLPPFDQSAVDGYGLHTRDIAAGKIGPFRFAGRQAAGARRSPVLFEGSVVRVLTGAAISPGVGAVVMEEKVIVAGETVRLQRPADPGLNIRRAGEDVGAHTAIVEAGTRIDARHIAILAASGVARVSVKRPVKVAVLSTGNELVRAGRVRHPHQIYDSNGPMVRALFAAPTLDVRMLGCCPDDPELLIRQLRRAAAVFDFLICSGGVSGSDADHVVASVLAAGGVCSKLSLALKPGKPLAVGRIGAMALLALPGNPVAALVGALLFARPMLQTLAGESAPLHATIMAKTAATFAHRLGRTEFVPVRIVGHDAEGTPLLEKLGRGGSARLHPLVVADGLGSIPAENDDLPRGSALRYYPFRTAFNL